MTDTDTTITEGAILVSTWGHGQTNVDFYKVLKIKNGWATLTKIYTDVVEPLEDYMGEYVEAWDSSNSQSQTFRRKIQSHRGTEYVPIDTFSAASVWNGKPVLQTHTH